MAAALFRSAAGNRFEVSSAGTEPDGPLDMVDEVLQEVGIGDFSPDKRAVSSLLARPPDLVIVVCEEGRDQCPYLPGAKRVVRWPQPDPDTAPATERVRLLRRIRDDLQLRISYLVNLPESWTVLARGPAGGEHGGPG